MQNFSRFKRTHPIQPATGYSGVGGLRVTVILLSTYRDQKILANLFQIQDLTVLILAAQLTPLTKGWINLELCGSSDVIDRAISYLQNTEIELVWKSPQAGESWYY